MNLNTELAQLFVAIVRYGNVLQASEHLHIDHSTLNKKLQRLEDQVGQLILSRRQGHSKLVLTELGQRFLLACEQLLETSANLERDMAHIKNGYTKTLRLALSPALSQTIYQYYLAPFSQVFPEVTYRLHECTVADQEHALLTGKSELGLSNSSLLNPASFVILDERPIRYSIICNKRTRHLDTSRSYRLQDLRDVPLCLTQSSGVLLEAALQGAGIQPKIVSINSLRETSAFAAKLDLGITLYPTEVPPTDEELVIVPLEEPSLVAKEILFRAPDHRLSPVAAAFVDFYKKHRL